MPISSPRFPDMKSRAAPRRSSRRSIRALSPRAAKRFACAYVRRNCICSRSPRVIDWNERAGERLDPCNSSKRDLIKTSLGIWAFGSMVIRFVPLGYEPEYAGHKARVEEVR